MFYPLFLRAGSGLLWLAASGAAFASDLPPGDCWKATFREQLSGEVREKTTRGGPYGYFYSYEGDFKWVADPASTPVDSEYVFCFRKNLDEGGVLIVGGKQIELGRVGSVKLPPLVHETAGYSYTSTRDHFDFPTLYGSFRTATGSDTSLEIQLDRVRSTTTVVASTRQGKKRVVSYMAGDAQKVER